MNPPDREPVPGASSPAGVQPNPRRKPLLWTLVAGAAVVAVAAMVLGSLVLYRNVQAAGSSARPAVCFVEGSREATMDRKGDGEPIVTIPLTAGWEKMPPDTLRQRGMPPDVRGGIVNTGIAENGQTPTIVVIVKSSTDRSRTNDEINDLSVQRIAETDSITRQSKATLCGNTVYQVDAVTQIPGELFLHKTYLVVLTDHGDTRWAVNLMMQTTDPDNPQYIAQRDALLRGFRVEMPKD